MRVGQVAPEILSVSLRQPCQGWSVTPLMAFDDRQSAAESSRTLRPRPNRRHAVQQVPRRGTDRVRRMRRWCFGTGLCAFVPRASAGLRLVRHVDLIRAKKLSWAVSCQSRRRETSLQEQKIQSALCTQFWVQLDVRALPNAEFLFEGRAGLRRVSGFCRDRILDGRDSQRLGKSAFEIKPQSAFTDWVQSVAYRSKDGIWFATTRAILYRWGQQWGQPSIIYFNSTFIINALQILFGSRRPYVYDSF
jgi:hypothetical protein